MKQSNFLKFATMLVAVPRYVGLMLYLSGFVFNDSFLSVLHIAEGVAGLALAVLEGWAISYILSRRQLGFSKTDKTLLFMVVGVLLLLLPLCATPYLLSLFDGSNLFVAQQNGFVAKVLGQQNIFVIELFKFVWVAATASMPILIIIGVALVEKDPVDVQIINAERQALLEQRLAEIEAQTEQKVLQFKLQAQQARNTHRTEKNQLEHDVQQKVNKPFACTSCGAAFESTKALAGHIGKCKSRTNGKHIELEEVQHDN